MNDLTVIGIDIAKNFIQIHGANDKGKTLLKKRLSREKFLPFMANLSTCLIGMEACGGAHYWAQELTKLGFEVKLMSPRKVKKFVENNKNDENDAAACSEAVIRQNMLFVPIKTRAQMEIQAIHRVRSFHVKQRTALMNMIRGILLETGIAITKGKSALIKKLNELQDADNDQLTEPMKSMLQNLCANLKKLDTEIDGFKNSLEKLAEEDESCM